jgi:four helix bundle protein
MEETEVCIRASALSDEIYKSVVRWPAVARQTIGIQLINSIDSVGANLIEGDGRGPGLMP